VHNAPLENLEALRKLAAQYGVSTSICRIHRALVRRRISFKKCQNYVQKKCKEAKDTYLMSITAYEPYQFVFIDEIGSDKKALHPRYGYSYVGEPCVAPVTNIVGERVSLSLLFHVRVSWLCTQLKERQMPWTFMIF